MSRYGLIGYPLGHSLSPEIHQKLFALEGMQAEYSLLEISPQTLLEHLPSLKTFAAFNVTIPHKQTVMSLLDGLDESAKLYGAVNSVHNENGRLIGGNTDCGGFLRTMQAHGIALDGRVCVVGAGGVGRMFAIECARQGAAVTIAARDPEKAAPLVDEIREKLGKTAKISALDAICTPFDLLINATPVGMFPHTDGCPVEGAALANVDAVFDCIYNPSKTRLLQQAEALGKTAVGGMDMLVWQAAIAHENWHGSHFSDAEIGEIIAEMKNQLLDKEQKR